MESRQNSKSASKRPPTNSTSPASSTNGPTTPAAATESDLDRRSIKPSRGRVGDTVFTPFEHAVLSDWFRIARPRSASEVDIGAAVNEQGEPLLRQETNTQVFPDMALRNAVAQIVLKSRVRALPNHYSARFPKGARAASVAADGKPVALMPVHLLTINWASSAPGLWWPEAYYVTYVPGYDRFVVTLSEDSSGPFGCEDVALGRFRSRRDLKYSSSRIISRFWRHGFDSWSQGRWQECFSEGLLSGSDAKRLADRVWGHLEYGEWP